MKQPLSVRNTIIKSDKSVMQTIRGWKQSGGALFAVKKIGAFALLAVRRFFREYVVLAWLLLRAKNGEIVKTVQGNKMILDLTDAGISRELALYGVHEKNSTALLKTIMKPGMKVVEAGANIGYYTLIEASLIGPSGYIYAFEPSPDNVALLKRNVTLNAIQQIEIHPEAVGAAPGKEKFYISGKSNLSSFIDRAEVAKAEADTAGRVIDVDVVSLDSFLQDKTVDYIRMDVEGFEREILAGLAATFRTRPPQYLFIEVHSELLHRRGSSAKEILTLLQSYGYDVKKSFYRGGSDIVVEGMSALLAHPLVETGYWETFFEQRKG